MLINTYKQVRPTVVALGSKLVRTPLGISPLYPDVIGTGFLVHQAGLVATNSHVAEALMKLPKHPLTGVPCAVAMLMTPTVEQTETFGAGVLMVEPKAYALPEEFRCGSPYYGQDIPDIAFIKLKVRNTPVLELNTEPNVLEPGLSIAAAGFPLGTPSLTVYRKVTQITPFLRRGIVSSVLPFECPRPHGFTTDIMIQGGSSGSPVFREDSPAAVGILHAFVTGAPNISLGVPSSLISAALTCVVSEGIDEAGDPDYVDLLNQAAKGATLEFETLSL
jgi:S1-C subfamily serine protease